MRSRTALAALAILSLFAPIAARAADVGEEKETEQKLKAGDRDKAFLLKVNNAVRKGMEWIIDQQEEDGSFDISKLPEEYPGGETALALLALLKSGVPRHDDVIKKGFDFLKTVPIQQMKTYTAGLTIMALEARWSPQKVEQRISGHTSAGRPGKAKIPRQDLTWMQELTVFLVENMVYSKLVTQNGVITTPKNVWSYPKSNSGDHSNTQYAILGLRSAQRSGVPLPRKLWEDVWSKVADHFIEVQEKDGPQVMRMKMIEDKEHGYVSYKSVTQVPDRARGWTYSSGMQAKPGGTTHSDSTTGSMTSVGVASVIMALEGLTLARSPKLNSSRRSEIMRAANDGLAWMTKNFLVNKNPGHPDGSWTYYYLYGLERACVLGGARNLGTHDWYREGAEWLIKMQNGDGSWNRRTSMGTFPATCFALLFLTKATIPGRVQITR